MSRLAIALVLALAATAANAQDTKSEQSHTPAVDSAKGTRPFLFDGRMRGDGVRQGALADDHHPTLAPSWCHRKQASLGANDQHTLRTPDARIAPNVIFCCRLSCPRYASAA